ncbi:uncharacterized protein V1516DRAFT_697017 [Lipomyces oligophaga]|uniref:uncharacterized protein n=1 Tax=Lipomyces oligophaga TaxID=45792 RepID=UPI0034CD256F
MNRQLVSQKNIISQLAYCSIRDPNRRAKFLIDAVTPEGYFAKVRFRMKESKSPFYNPNILPYPYRSAHPYLGIGRLTTKTDGIAHHDLVYCDLQWARTRVIGRAVLECVEDAVKIDMGKEWSSPDGSCVKHDYLAVKQGLLDPRIFFSPLGEPLMVVGSNGQKNCLSQYVVDLRTLIPELTNKMRLHNVPIRYWGMTELPRSANELQEVEKNWFLLYDSLDSNKEYIHYDYATRSISASKQPEGETEFKSIANPTPQVVTGLLLDLRGVEHAENELHQATNSLLVTMCDFPCIPTIHNTVLIEILHVKYLNIFEVFYRRYAIVMNATAPFNIIGRTENLMYAGTSATDLVYTVSIVWDNEQYPTHEMWDEKIHGGQEIWRALDRGENPFKLRLTADNQNGEQARNEEPEEPDEFQKREEPAEEEPIVVQQNPFVTSKYHGWLNDMVMITFGLRDVDTGNIHVQARDLLDCIVYEL